MWKKEKLGYQSLCCRSSESVDVVVCFLQDLVRNTELRSSTVSEACLLCPAAPATWFNKV